jgi:hypothetical protein
MLPNISNNKLTLYPFFKSGCLRKEVGAMVADVAIDSE